MREFILNIDKRDNFMFIDRDSRVVVSLESPRCFIEDDKVSKGIEKAVKNETLIELNKQHNTKDEKDEEEKKKKEDKKKADAKKAKEKADALAKEREKLEKEQKEKEQKEKQKEPKTE